MLHALGDAAKAAIKFVASHVRSHENHHKQNPRTTPSNRALNPGEDNPLSHIVPGVLGKFGWDHDAEVRAW